MFKKITLFAVCLLMVMAGQHQACADARYSIKQLTPEVKSALDNRRERYDQLRQLKSSGAVGETNQGYVEAFDGSAGAVVSAENGDRKVIYTTIAEQNGLSDALGTIESVFGQVQRDKAESGDKIQAEDGTWGKK